MNASLQSPEKTPPEKTRRDQSSWDDASRDAPQTEDDTRSELADGTTVFVLHRLINASRQATRTTRLANDLCGDPDFKSWLDQLCEQHDNFGEELQDLLEAHNIAHTGRFSVRSSLTRLWMRCARRMLVLSDFVLMDACRHSEYQLQAAYEMALWMLPPGTIRETVEDQFQQFVLHRSLIPVRRLPQTREFLHQAERLQQIHSQHTLQETSP